MPQAKGLADLMRNADPGSLGAVERTGKLLPGRGLWQVSAAAAALVALIAFAPAARGQSEVHNGGRIRIDGFSDDFTDSESVFMLNTRVSPPVLEESRTDSRWQDNDISQIKFTWDADSVYIAADGVINGNNMLLLFDVGNPAPGILHDTGARFNGLTSMANLNSWRRNFVFDNGFAPDLFMATWDGNTTPKLLTVQGANTVLDESPANASGGTGQFRSAASFSGTKQGSMELAIPWWKFLGFSSPTGLERRYIPEYRDTVTVLPPGVRFIRFAGVVTGGGDGTGGPDSAPDNLQGHEVDAGIQETIDNFAILDLDTLDVNGRPGPDGIPDFSRSGGGRTVIVQPKSRITFKVQPPIRSVRFELDSLAFSRPSFAPSRQQRAGFRFAATSPDLSGPSDLAGRSVTVSAAVYDMRGQLVRRIYTNDRRPAERPADGKDSWDGRDDNGSLVPGGIYLLRLVLEPAQFRKLAPIVVVR